MKNRLKLLVVLLTLVSVTLACNLPAIGLQPAGQATPTPNLTMTALFASGLLGSLTPQADTPQVASATPDPTETGAILPDEPTSVPAVPTHTSAPVIDATSTAPPTLTPRPATPTALPTQVLARGGTQVKAYFLRTPPTLDGVWDEWTTAAFPATFVTFGRENWTGEDDLEGSFRLGWDQNNLYIAVKIIDDAYVQNASGQDIFLGDSIEILFDRDLLGDFFSASLTNDDYQLGISPGNPDVNGTKEAYLWYPSGLAGTRPDVKIAAVRAGGVTRVEAAIPWGTFGVVPALDQRFGFVLSASDTDTSGMKRQESMVSSVRTRRLTDPTTWGEVLLTR
ncbi:MAG TPA: sugar-binding protein [Levilinea sp.]|nr:sugar-binding protein [Levilinea sp.]